MGPEIVIADNNQEMRQRIAKALSDRMHSVRTTRSAAHLMHHLLHGMRPLVILGDGLEEGLSIANLLPLLKSCLPSLTVILVTDNLSFPEEVKVRQLNVFYRMNRPVTEECWHELQQAIECACQEGSTAGASTTH